MEKTITVQIAQEDLKTLKESGYRLCFAKKVAAAEYNVVWQAYDNYLFQNQFSWVPEYQLFCSNSCVPGESVFAATNLVDIKIGMTSVLNEYGWLSEPAAGYSAACLTLRNNYRQIHPGIMQTCTGINSVKISAPIYVSEFPVVKGHTLLMPIDKILIWFEQETESSTIINHLSSNNGSWSESIELDLTSDNSKSIIYENEEWKIIS
jgi:hypothetical protein